MNARNSKSNGKAKPDITTFRPSVSHPVLNEEIILHSQHAQRLLGIVFYRAQAAVYALGSRLQFLARDERLIDEAVRTVVSMIDQAIHDLKDEQDRLTILSQQHDGFTLLTYTAPQTVALPCYTPEARRFVELLQRYDTVVRLVESLWMYGKLTGRQRTIAIRQWSNRLVKLARHLSNINGRAGAALRKQQMAAAAQRHTNGTKSNGHHAPSESTAEAMVTSAQDDTNPPPGHDFGEEREMAAPLGAPSG